MDRTMKLYTFGYLGQSRDQFAAWLTAHDAILFDIRESPYSRNMDWRQAALRKALAPRYFWCQDLGNLNYRDGGTHARIHNLPRGIWTVESQLKPIVLMCACRSYETCHRRAVGEALRERGHTVEELVL